MERLSKELTGIINEQDFCFTPGEMKTVEMALGRLKNYEDTGLEPEKVKLIANVLREVGETYNCMFNYVAQCVIEHSKLQELAQAEKDGRLVIVGRCKDCAHWVPPHIEKNGKFVRGLKKREIVPLSEGINVSSYCSMVDAVFVHGFREGEPSSDKTKAWIGEDEFCSKFQRKGNGNG